LGMERGGRGLIKRMLPLTDADLLTINHEQNIANIHRPKRSLPLSQHIRHY
jgi:hypothetical protein